jgi:O-antigen/teichoic acid export membrane protein
MVAVGRLLGKEGFGQLGMIRSTVGMLGPLAGLALGLTANRHVAGFRQTDPARAGRVIGLSSLVAAVSSGAVAIALFLGAPALAAETLAAKSLEDPALMVRLLQIGCVMLFFEGILGAQMGVLAGFEAFRAIATINLLVGLLSLPVMLVAVWLWALPGAVVALASVPVIGWALSRRALCAEARRAGVPISYSRLSSELRILFRFTLPALLAGVLVGPVQWAASAILVNSSAGYAGLGLFNAANQWQTPIMFFSAKLCSVLLPVLASFSTAHEGRDQSARAVNAAFVVTVTIVLPSTAVLACLSRPIIGLYGPQFAEALPIFSAVIFIAAARALGNVASTTITSRGAMWVGFAINVSWGVLLLGLVHSWVDRGVTAFANAMAVSYAATSFAALILLGTLRFVGWHLVLRIGSATIAAALIGYAPVVTRGSWAVIVIVASTAVAVVSCGFLPLRRSLATAQLVSRAYSAKQRVDLG